VKAVSFGAYQGHLRSLIHLLKYDGMQPLAHRLGGLLARSLNAFADDFGEPRRMLVVPVPMHRAKQRRRGFNHAALLAQAAISKLGRGHPRSDLRSDLLWDLRLAVDVLERVKPTESQAGLTAGQRRRNLRGAFVARQPAQLAGSDVLLVDDVYTTGATARACSRVLIAAGAASVRVATVARAQREGIALWDAHFMHQGG
jgi:ComF family protein